MLNLQKFNSYLAEDFILDDDFREIVRSSLFNNDLNDLLENLPEKKDEIDLAISVLQGLETRLYPQSEERKAELWNELLKTQQVKSSIPMWFKIAASFLLLISIQLFFYFMPDHRLGQDEVASNENFSNRSNEAQLILANGKRVAISSNYSKVEISADGSGILLNDSSDISQPDDAIGLNQMIVPYGKRSTITLCDGTKVWINSGSKLLFPASFRGNSREVSLEGEALFEVSKNPEKPFYVKTGNFKLKVYGTIFNVQAYHLEKESNVVLVEGKVSMNSNDKSSEEVFLSPKQKATILEGENNFTIERVENTEFYTAWTQGYLTFWNEDVKNVLRRVSRYYNVDIKIELPSNIEKIYGKLDLKDDIVRVLNGIAFLSKTTYTKKENQYIFNKNNKTTMDE